MPIDVSVIVTTYNVERYIARTLASALDQAGPSLEVIVVDDCSTDNTWTRLCAMDDPRLRIVRLHSNGGPSVARNTGIAMATGSWIAVLDGDDQFKPGRLQRCLDLGVSRAADIVVDNLLIEREADGERFPMFSDATLRSLEPLTLARFIAGNGLFARGHTLGYLKPVIFAAFLRQHCLAYDPDIRIGEDYQFLAEALANGAVCAVDPIPGYSYTVRAGSISHRLALADIDRMSAADGKLWRRYRFDPEAAEAQQRRTRSLREAYAYTLLIGALKRKSLPAAIAAVRYCPGGVRHLWQPVWARVERLRRKL